MVDFLGTISLFAPLLIWIIYGNFLVVIASIYISSQKKVDILRFIEIFIASIGLFVFLSSLLPSIKEVTTTCGTNMAFAFLLVTIPGFIKISLVSSGVFIAFIVACIRSKRMITSGPEPPPKTEKKLFEQVEKTSGKRKMKITITKTKKEIEEIEIEEEESSLSRAIISPIIRSIPGDIEFITAKLPPRIFLASSFRNSEKHLKLLSHHIHDKGIIVGLGGTSSYIVHRLIENIVQYERAQLSTILNPRYRIYKDIRENLAKIEKQMKQQFEQLKEPEFTLMNCYCLNNKSERNNSSGYDYFESIMQWINQMYNLTNNNRRKVFSTNRKNRSLQHQPNDLRTVKLADNPVKDLGAFELFEAFDHPWNINRTEFESDQTGLTSKRQPVVDSIVPRRIPSFEFDQSGTGLKRKHLLTIESPDATKESLFGLDETRLTSYYTPDVKSPVVTDISTFELGETGTGKCMPVAQPPDGIRFAIEAFPLNVCSSIYSKHSLINDKVSNINIGIVSGSTTALLIEALALSLIMKKR